MEPEPNSSLFLEGLKEHFSERELALLKSASVGIAGAGGLGSNIAVMLARSGVGKMLIIDFDRVSASNLNRQHYWPRHLNQKKTDALAELLLELNPHIQIDALDLRLTPENLPQILPGRSIWIEALDSAEAKKMFVSEAVKTASLVVSGNGLAGYGGLPIGKKRVGNLLIAGDMRSCASEKPPLAPRVIQTAAIMADSVVEFILNASMSE